MSNVEQQEFVVNRWPSSVRRTLTAGLIAGSAIFFGLGGWAEDAGVKSNDTAIELGNKAVNTKDLVDKDVATEVFHEQNRHTIALGERTHYLKLLGGAIILSDLGIAIGYGIGRKEQQPEVEHTAEEQVVA